MIGFIQRTLPAAAWAVFIAANSGAAGAEAMKAAEVTDLYEAVAASSVEARVVVRDAYQLRVFLTKPGKEAMRLKLPAVIAARPVDLAAAQDPAK